MVYYGLHFVAYFWSPQGGCWVQFDDGAVREVAKTWRGLCELLVPTAGVRGRGGGGLDNWG